MNSDQTIIIDNPNIAADVNLAEKNFKDRLLKILSYLKPTIINALITFTAFIIIIAITKKLGVTVIISIAIYLIISLFVQPLYSDKLRNRFNGFSSKKKNVPTIIASNNNSIVLLAKNKTLIGISLLKAEWLENYLNLNPIWDLLQQEGVQIQDCREGCFFVIRKNIELKRNDTFQNKAIKLVKEIEKTILLLKKRFDIEYDNLNLYLVKGQEIILTTINLGLYPMKFASNQEISDEDLDYIRTSSLDVKEVSVE